MDPAAAAVIAKAAIVARSNKKTWTGTASVIAAICLLFILIVVCLMSVASGGADHNRAAVRLAFGGGDAGAGMPADYREYIAKMQESFSELDTVLDGIEEMAEGGAAGPLSGQGGILFPVFWRGQGAAGCKGLCPLCRLFCGL